MADEQLSREQIYERIRQTSKEEYILSEMKRLGFWDVSDGLPKVSEELIERKGKLQRELNELVEKQRLYNNREAMLKEMRQKRMADALAKREETKKRRLAKKQAQQQAWQAQQKEQITYLGQGYSGGLSQTQSDETKLQALGLPLFGRVLDLAEAMELSLGQLRFLCYHRDVSTKSHYRRFLLPKKSGGFRTISAPMPKLKAAQHWVLQNILYQLQPHQAAHGFVPQHSIVSNAQQHLRKTVVINIDLKDFFPTVTHPRVKGLFQALGYSEQLASIFALLCTEPLIDEVVLDGQTYYVRRSERFLPQGAPSSPALTNLLCRRLDARLEGMAKQLGATYTRYADDMTISLSSTANIQRVLWQVQQVAQEEGFTVHPDKVQVMRPGDRKEVTGIVVNEKLNVPKDTLKRFRAVLHKIETGQAQDVQWGKGSLKQAIQGFANYVRMVNPEKGQALVDKVQQLLQNPQIKAQLQNLQKPSKISLEKTENQGQATENQPKDELMVAKKKKTEDKPWWSLW